MSNDLATDATMLWANPGASEKRPTLVRLTPDALTLAVVPKADLEAVLAELQAGGDVAGQAIPLSSLVGASGDQDSASLTVTFRTGPSKKESQAIAFVDKTERDEFVAALVGALGPGWRSRPKPLDRWTAGFWTLMPTAVVALATWGLHVEAARIAAGLPPADWGRGKLRLVALAAHWAEQQLGPTGILIAGGILVAVGLALFALVMSAPPTNLVVEPDEAS